MKDGIFDVEYLRTDMGLDTATIAELKDIYATSIEDVSISLYSFFSALPIDLEAVYPLVHTLKGTAASVNDLHMSEAAEKICKMVKTDNDPYSQKLMSAGNDLLELASQRLDYLRTLVVE